MPSLIIPGSVQTQQHVKISRHVPLFLISFIATAMGGTISTLMSVYLPVVVAELLQNRAVSELNNISAFINAVLVAGWTVGGFAWGYLSDRIGRKWSLVFSVATLGLATLLTGFMHGWEGVVIFRFLSGVGMGGILVVTNTYMSEVWPEKSKAIFIGILSVSFPIGIFSAGLINYLVSGWREGFLVGLIPCALAVAAYFCLKESPQWLASRHKKSSNENNATSHAHARLLILGSVTFGTMLIGLWAIFSWLPTWVQSLIVQGDGQHERGTSMMLLGIGGLTGGFISGWISNALGLRRSMIICFAVCGVLCLVLFKTNKTFDATLVYSEIALLSIFFGISQGVLSVFVPLLFPVAVRASATGFCFNIGRILTALAVLFVGVLVDFLGGYSNALFIFSLVFIVGLITLVFNQSMKKNATY
jgi:MFS family permease